MNRRLLVLAILAIAGFGCSDAANTSTSGRPPSSADPGANGAGTSQSSDGTAPTQAGGRAEGGDRNGNGVLVDAGADPGSAIDASTNARSPLTYPLYGVTLDCGYKESDGIDGRPGLAQLNANLSDILDSLSHLAHRPTTRIVFDPMAKASDYVNAASQVSNVSFVMGEIMDSSNVSKLSVADYKQRTTTYIQTLKPYVDIWEIGNEVNGDWLGNDNDVVEKISDAFDQVKAIGGRTALTIVHNDGDKCSNTKNPRDMLVWAEDHIPQQMKDGLDFVLVSYYENDCADWKTVFRTLGTMFPNAKVGFGEIGDDHNQAAYVRQFYGMDMKDVPRYVGGYFYWYCFQDMVPRSKPLWDAFNQVIAQ